MVIGDNMKIHQKTINISPKILKLISQIDEFKGSWIALGQLAPDRLTSLRKVATVESVASSTRIEGVKLSDSEVKILLTGLDINSFKSRDEEEVAGYAEVMNMIFSNHMDMIPSENLIKQLHQLLLKFSSKDIRHRGEYKKLNNHVEAFGPNGESLGIVFQTSSPLEAPLRMEALSKWLESSFEESEEHVLIIIAKFVVEFLEIHPFQDGNGRLSRVLTTLLLLRSGYDYVPYSSLERIIEENKDRYYLFLRNAQSESEKNSAELGNWITFFLECLAKQKDNLQFKLEKERALMSLPKLSEQILITLKDHGMLSLSEIVKITGANRNTVKSHLFKLVEATQIQQTGKGKGTRYSL